MIVERNVEINEIRVPDWIEAKMDGPCGRQDIKLATLKADEADDLLKRFCDQFRRKFVLGEKK